MAEGLDWGDIRLIDFGAPDKRRPALILTRATHLPHLTQILVAPITRTVRGIATELLLGPENGLKDHSAAKLDQIQAIHRDLIGRFVGSVGRERLPEIREAVLFSMGLDAESE